MVLMLGRPEWDELEPFQKKPNNNAQYSYRKRKPTLAG
jgi:hypothetical protein